ncbi:recombinase family protein [Leuconostoc mesenteroides]|uniref:recombinase family protein n=1 Tax=Leuconostoc mesenteroides TaxID=1245 RepID=UPI001CBCE3FA|nr:recombinase family protein [Leuconostoc mesenteroides]MBZ1523869.1 recombinase family protein [Leuconostoc mesenteroides]
MTVFGYARVSTAGQSLSEQKETLKKSGAKIIFSEKYSGTTTARPQFSKLVKTIQPNDILIVTKLDRLARNTREALNLIDDLLREKIIIKVLNLGTIDNTTMGRMIIRTLLSIAEMERDMIIERTQAGKIFAKQHNPNYKEGRTRRKKGGRNTAIFEYSQIHTVKKTAEAFNISPRTVQYIKKLFNQKD